MNAHVVAALLATSLLSGTAFAQFSGGVVSVPTTAQIKSITSKANSKVGAVQANTNAASATKGATAGGGIKIVIPNFAGPGTTSPIKPQAPAAPAKPAKPALGKSIKSAKKA